MLERKRDHVLLRPLRDVEHRAARPTSYVRGGRSFPWSTSEVIGARRDDLDALTRFGFQIERHPYLGVAFRDRHADSAPTRSSTDCGTRRDRPTDRRLEPCGQYQRRGCSGGASTLANDGLVVLAEEQTAGRGQRGRLWTAPPRSSILMSILTLPPAELRPRLSRRRHAWLTALAAVTTAEVVTRWTGRDARIKWPNDVRVEGRKIAGILVEAVTSRSTSLADGERMRHQGVVIGIGLNVNVDQENFPADLRPRATSLAILGGE